ncbi:Metallo-dependent phosphatase-like protein [Lipomyces arxii]|uniref:Metallo-dependent phosphatase-like protein n=1 Tax=Lipomyces arxii TaxID=56418 RepID=UPI0034CF0A34
MPTYEASYPPNLYHPARPRSEQYQLWPFKGPLSVSVSKWINAVTAMVVVWLHVLYWGERTVYSSAIDACDWSRWENWPEGASPERVVLVADPQLVDPHTYPGRNFVFLGLTEYYVDKYMHRTWGYLESMLDSDATIFLGDLFDGGREWDHDVWVDEFKRFQKIFPVKEGKLTLFETAGNHDIGLGDTIVVDALQRFTAYFGEPNRQIVIGNHSIVILDTDSMMNTNNEEIYGPPRAFFDDIVRKSHTDPFPLVLLTHIPLYRPPDSPCGPKREGNPSIPIAKGYQYQNVLNSDLSDEILHKLHPVAVFSGDDHDACRHVHEYAQGRHTTVEYTVKTFSIAMGVSYPAFEMISLWNPRDGTTDRPTLQARLCMLPSQFDIFKFYFKILIVTFVVEYAAAYKAWRARKKYGTPGLDVLGSEKKWGGSVYTNYYTVMSRKIWSNKWAIRIWGRPATFKNEFMVRMSKVASVVCVIYMWLLFRNVV